MEKVTKAIEEGTKEETKEEAQELTNEEVHAMHEEMTKPRVGTIYSRLGRSYSNERHESPKARSYAHGAGTARDIVG